MPTIEENLVNSYLAFKANIIDIRKALDNGNISVDSLRETFVNKIIDLYVTSDFNELKDIVAENLREKLLYGKGVHLQWEKLFPQIEEKLLQRLRGTVIYIYIYIYI